MVGEGQSVRRLSIQMLDGASKVLDTQGNDSVKSHIVLDVLDPKNIFF